MLFWLAAVALAGMVVEAADIRGRIHKLHYPLEQITQLPLGLVGNLLVATEVLLLLLEIPKMGVAEEPQVLLQIVVVTVEVVVEHNSMILALQMEETEERTVEMVEIVA